MAEKKDILDSIISVLKEGHKSINEISKETGMNWSTAEENLSLLKDLNLVEEKEIKNARTFFYKDKNNYFELPVKKEHSKKISSIYCHIRKICFELFKKEPTKTQTYKIIWKINKELNLGLPIGWYKYGPCCVQVYRGNEEEEMNLDRKTILVTKETVNKYCLYDSSKLQSIVYDEAKEKLYQLKEKLLACNLKTKEDINPLLMDLIKYSPQETIEVVTDFARASLLLGWEKTKPCFDTLWKYITLVVFRNSIEFYYKDALDIYLKNKTEEAKKEAQLYIMELVKSNKKIK